MRLPDLRCLRVRRLAIPLAVYLVITLGLPLAHGAAARDHFAAHAGWVVLGCVCVVAMFGIAGLAIRVIGSVLRRARRLLRPPQFTG